MVGHPYFWCSRSCTLPKRQSKDSFYTSRTQRIVDKGKEWNWNSVYIRVTYFCVQCIESRNHLFFRVWVFKKNLERSYEEVFNKEACVTIPSLKVWYSNDTLGLMALWFQLDWSKDDCKLLIKKYDLCTHKLEILRLKFFFLYMINKFYV